MGNISKKLRRKLASNSKNLPTTEPKRRPGEPLPGGIIDVPTLIKDGFDPVHAAYAFMQQMSSHFAAGVSQMPEMKAYYKVVVDAEDNYMPAGPPISPLTASFFTTWAFYDLRIGNSGDTIGDCQIELNDVIWLNADQLDALKKLNNSRMGIYEHVGFDGPHVRLRELITEDEVVCHNASGYRGLSGELWYVRLLPPLLPGLANYHVAFTTPYVLIQSTKNDWTNFSSKACCGSRRTASGRHCSNCSSTVSTNIIGTNSCSRLTTITLPRRSSWPEYQISEARFHTLESLAGETIRCGLPEPKIKQANLRRIERMKSNWHPSRSPTKLQLGKGSAFVKTKLRRLSQVKDTWEADFQSIRGSRHGQTDFWLGMVVEQEGAGVLASLSLDQPPTVNDLATLLAHAMTRPLTEGHCHRPTTILLRPNSESEELLPHLRQLGIDLVSTGTLAVWSEAAQEFGVMWERTLRSLAADSPSTNMARREVQE